MLTKPLTVGNWIVDFATLAEGKTSWISPPYMGDFIRSKMIIAATADISNRKLYRTLKKCKLQT
jgi:hypothetical protein